jgi:hypothetical protein
MNVMLSKEVLDVFKKHKETHDLPNLDASVEHYVRETEKKNQLFR